MSKRNLIITLILCSLLFTVIGCSGQNNDSAISESSNVTPDNNPTETETPETRIKETVAETDSDATEEAIVRIENTAKTESASETDNQDIAFAYDEIRFIPTDPASPIIEALGEPDSFYEAPSCVFAGNDQVYAYPGFEINTASYNDLDVIVGIFLTDGQVSTPEGITVGSTLDEAIDAYGEPDIDDGTGQITWHYEGFDLIIVNIDNQITSLSYLGQFGQ